ncbi:MAG: diaminopimelate decarboxylase [Candidatus Dadabacteria bacterium]|nr:diaminopimelate decarboxylase [Candidatus Dadabacteria bacterium]MYA48170.1 diaminopimelate decarboxylase [Candidatus Dadabacteria bacterium]MYK49682.1 diaminopimelate decarboxylase [Candidatus Dadabacteria bacterium]
MTSDFEYTGGELYVEKVPVRQICEDFGTPVYIYSHNSIRSSFLEYREAFSEIDPLICYSVKANSNISVLKIFSSMDSGFDIVSSGELQRVVAAGGDTSRVVFSGVGKTGEEIEAAIRSRILFFNVESEAELEKINEVAVSIGERAPVAIRVNPDIDPDTHPYISTGFEKSKFGIGIAKAVDVYRNASRMRGIEIRGIDAHIGSQIFDLSSFSESISKLVYLADRLGDDGIEISYIDIGGGLAISYESEEKPPAKSEYAQVFEEHLHDTSYGLVLEPGRSVVGNAGIMATKVLYVKEGTSKKFVIVDAAMNDLVRPAFYNSFHRIEPVHGGDSGSSEIVDIVGPICESGDFLARDRSFPAVSAGELLAVFSAGAYGFVMSSNYNTRPRAAEVLVSGDRYCEIRARETLEDMLKAESIAEFL